MTKLFNIEPFIQYKLVAVRILSVAHINGCLDLCDPNGSHPDRVCEVCCVWRGGAMSVPHHPTQYTSQGPKMCTEDRGYTAFEV